MPDIYDMSIAELEAAHAELAEKRAALNAEYRRVGAALSRKRSMTPKRQALKKFQDAQAELAAIDAEEGDNG